jgi:hypothetical protein
MKGHEKLNLLWTKTRPIDEYARNPGQTKHKASQRKPLLTTLLTSANARSPTLVDSRRADSLARMDLGGGQPSKRARRIRRGALNRFGGEDSLRWVWRHAS